MFGKHQDSDKPAPERLRPVDPSVPSRACCCPAQPVVKVIMHTGPARDHVVDLWLCGHHYRENAVALQSAEAIVTDLALAAELELAGHPAASDPTGHVRPHGVTRLPSS